MKRTYQPSKLVRKRRHGFRSKMKTKGGKKLLARRRKKRSKKTYCLMNIKIKSLSKNEDFKKLLNGRKISNSYLTIFFKKIPNKKNTCLNISFVAKKKMGKAVDRNKIKRRLKNMTYAITKIAKLNLNFSYLVLAKKSVLEEKYDEIKEALQKSFEKIS